MHVTRKGEEEAVRANGGMVKVFSLCQRNAAKKGRRGEEGFNNFLRNNQ